MAVNIAYVATTADASDSTTYTFTDHAIGSAASNRVVIVEIVGIEIGVATRVISGVTIGGNAASEVVQANGSAGGNSVVGGIFALAVPTGTTATIAVTFSGAMDRAAISVYAMTGGGATAFDTLTATGTSLSGTIDCPAGGGIVGTSYASFLSPGTATWTGITEDNDQTVENANNVYSAAHDNFASQQTGLTVSVAWSGGSSDNAVLVAASFEEETEDGVAESDGQATVTGVGASTFAAVGSSDGQATVSGVGASIFSAAGEADSLATVQGVGTGVFNAVGLSAGVASVAANGTGVFNSVGLSAGRATVLGILDKRLMTSTNVIHKPVDVVLMGQQRVPENPNGMSKALLRSIFGE